MGATVDGLDFPHAAQVARVVRHRTCLTTGRRSRETVYVITGLNSQEGSPQRLAKIISLGLSRGGLSEA
ncbi:hypothetical protein WBG99_17940 [Streptomyces sp. TG1A-60]|uniref:hypothetical protein n=1 Tax=Streptomyces sp. TG1A-60 TaxID=3129111 RepID=UPI0030CFEFFD